MPKRWTDHEVARAQQLRETGRTWRQIAEHLSAEWGEPITKSAVEWQCKGDQWRERRQPRADGPRPDHDTIPRIELELEIPAARTDRDVDVDVDVLVEATRRDTTFEKLCDALRWWPEKLRAVIARAHSSGKAIYVDGDRVGRPPHVAAEEREHVVVPIAHEGIFAVASDIHVGSKYFLREQFQDFVRAAYAAGARVILGPGDNLDGCYRHSRWEWTHDGFDSQSEYAAEVFPRLDGLRYVIITGNHDETFEESAGLSVPHALTDTFRRAGRSDLECIGQRGAYVRLQSPGQRRGLIVELWHPRTNPAYALSYQLQKKIEAYAVGQKPDVVLAGHWHQQVYFVHRGVHAFSCGTFHGGGGAFGRSLKGAPQIGGWIIRYALTEHEAVRELTPTWRGYQEVEEVRSVDLG